MDFEFGKFSTGESRFRHCASPPHTFLWGVLTAYIYENYNYPHSIDNLKAIIENEIQ